MNRTLIPDELTTPAVLVERAVHDDFLVHAVAEIQRAAYTLENGNYVRIINDRNLHRLLELIDPAKIHHGGGHDPAARLIDPTILTGVGWDDKVMAEEIFGPILPVLAYDDLDEAIRAIKARPKPLACYAFTGNRATKDKILREISFGGGAINDAVMHIANSSLPFGGVGDSGTGAYHGEDGFRAFSHMKGVLEQVTWLDPFLRYPPHGPKKLRLLQWLMR